MAHDHSHAPANYNKAFAFGVILNLTYIVLEAVFGILVNSLALLADAGHNLSDVLGLLLAWGAHYLSQIKPTERHTYGWRSTTILASLFNAIILLVAIGGIMWEAIRRFEEPESIEGFTIIWVAGVGVLINAITAYLFFKGRENDLNIKGAFLHMAADAGVSLGVVIAGVGLMTTGLYWIDPVTSILVAVVIFIGTWGLLKDSINLALQAVPTEVDFQAVKEYLASLQGVEAVHDLHIWAMSTTETALTAHLVKPKIEDNDPLLAKATEELHHRFSIEHVTLQIERNPEVANCHQVKEDSV
ncbi:Cobalt-zinc-cadmium resistance protein czcd [Planctomycetales bacterium 10988]|nr:Cobalt-zinc-cadmium resistance protein czcd [Planctomycetales bacterium 10988]